ncbi:MAG: S24/S26 family peptidase [Thermodesulfobacteriota bacterium]
MPPERELWVQGLRRGFSMRCRLLGKSMAPRLRPGDCVQIAPGERCRLGDIVLVDQGDHLVMHRVIARSKGRIITKGDATAHLDPPVAPPEILGRAVFRSRGGKETPLDSLWARWTGLACCLALAWLFTLTGAVKGWGRGKIGWPSLFNGAGPPEVEDGSISS